MQLPDPPTALFIENSFISLPLLYPLPRDNGKVPECLQKTEMVHFEDWPLDPAEDALHNKLFYPQRETTLLAIDWEAIGRIASKLLIDRIKNNETNGTKTVRVSPLLQKVSGKNREFIS
jgi:DNA-binding LacI/PurR family transcriptional regulator